MRIKNSHGARLGDCSVRSTTEHALFAMMSSLPADELQKRISMIGDPNTRTLAQAHADVLTDDWDGPIKV
jgi:hypothetical protein